jgi:cyclic pyranopterin phosphate synthase
METHPLRMIDVGGKPVTPRVARASGKLLAGADTIRRIRTGDLEKGDAAAAARLAGIMAAKRTADLIPLCHPLPLDSVDVALDFDTPGEVTIHATVTTVARTGVEMEALLAVSAAALTLYDMTKSIDPGMSIDRIRLEEKTGGTRGDWSRHDSPDAGTSRDGGG